MEASPYRHVTKQKTRSRIKFRTVWKLKLNITWQAIKKCNLKKRLHLSLGCVRMRSMKQLSSIHINQESHVKPFQEAKSKKKATHPNKTLAYLLHVPHTASDFVDNGDHLTPTLSPKQNISTIWHELHGSRNWDNLLDPLHSSLRREIAKYGEFAQGTYDAFDFDPLSEYCGSCRYNRHKIFETLGLSKHGYKVTKYIYALSHVDVPEWFKRSHVTWSKDSNWMGYVAVSKKEESQRIGRRDIMVAWRGTVSPSEWFNDLRTDLEHIDNANVKVQEGFLSIYKSNNELTRFNKLSASEQVMQEVTRLVNFYRGKGEKVSLTVTGHSLGGALALLNAYEAATAIPDLFVSVISFGAPRVGNIAFKKKLDELGVKTLRVVVKQDIVPKLPGLLNKMLNKFHGITGNLNWVYRHVGVKLKLDVLMSPYLKHESSDLAGCHNLELYLHLVDGFLSKKSKFRWDGRRDLALVNKSSDMLIEELKLPEFWYQFPYKGLVLNKYGRWVKPGRQLEDIPSPLNMY